MILHVVKKEAGKKKFGPKYKSEVRIPRSVRETYGMDKAQGTKVWKTAIKEYIGKMNIPNNGDRGDTATKIP